MTQIWAHPRGAQVAASGRVKAPTATTAPSASYPIRRTGGRCKNRAQRVNTRPGALSVHYRARYYTSRSRRPYQHVCSRGGVRLRPAHACMVTIFLPQGQAPWSTFWGVASQLVDDDARSRPTAGLASSTSPRRLCSRCGTRLSRSSNLLGAVTPGASTAFGSGLESTGCAWCARRTIFKSTVNSLVACISFISRLRCNAIVCTRAVRTPGDIWQMQMADSQGGWHTIFIVF